jgi:hypothetical protein
MRHHLKLHQYTVLLFLFCLLFGLAACQDEDIISNAYKTLSVAAETYDASMRAAADLDERGLLDDEAKAKVISIGGKCRAAHGVAVAALAAYAETSRAEDGDKLGVALAEVTRLVYDLGTILTPYITTGAITTQGAEGPDKGTI